MRIKAKTRSYDGTMVEETYMPTATKLIRAGVVSVNVAPGLQTNVFAAAVPALDSTAMKMNRRYTLLTSIMIQEGGVGAASHSVACNFRPDNRNQIARDITFTDSAGATVTATVSAHINFDKGLINFAGVSFTGGTGGITFDVPYAVFGLRFTPFNTNNGRTVVTVETEQTDLTIDPNEDFMLDLTEEDEYCPIYQ